MANEKRLIDANALLEDFGEEPMVWNDGEAEIQERNDWRTYTRMVKNAPTVDAVEVVHGRWVDRYGGKYANPLYECSRCYEKARYRVRVNELGNEYFVQALTDYCPNCGAKMDGDGNETI